MAANDEVEGIEDEGPGGIDSLTVVSAERSSLGLTDLDGESAGRLGSRYRANQESGLRYSSG